MILLVSVTTHVPLPFSSSSVTAMETPVQGLMQWTVTSGPRPRPLLRKFRDVRPTSDARDSFGSTYARTGAARPRRAAGRSTRR